MNFHLLITIIYCAIIIPAAIVCDGHISIGAGTVVDPTATIKSDGGDITIGGGCVINARVKIVNTATNSAMVIGMANVFNEDSSIESLKIGNSNVFMSKCFIGSKVTVGNSAVIGAGCILTEEQIIADSATVNCKDGKPIKP